MVETVRGPRAGASESYPCWYTLPTALQDLEPQQLLLFVQSFGIPVSSMSKLLQYLDQAVAQDPQTLEQNIMDKSKSWGHEASAHCGPPSPLGQTVWLSRQVGTYPCGRLEL